jgi:hypothetical protein
LGANAPCSARSRRCTSLMRACPGAVMGRWYPWQTAEAGSVYGMGLTADVPVRRRPGQTCPRPTAGVAWPQHLSLSRQVTT